MLMQQDLEGHELLHLYSLFIENANFSNSTVYLSVTNSKTYYKIIKSVYLTIKTRNVKKGVSPCIYHIFVWKNRMKNLTKTLTKNRTKYRMKNSTKISSSRKCFIINLTKNLIKNLTKNLFVYNEHKTVRYVCICHILLPSVVSWRRVVYGSLFLDPTQRNVDSTRSAIDDKKSDPSRPAARPFPHMYSLLLNNYLLIS